MSVGPVAVKEMKIKDPAGQEKFMQEIALQR